MLKMSRMDADFLFGVNRYGDTWKRHRRIFTHHVNPGAVMHVFSTIQIKATHTLLKQLIIDPKNLRGHLLHASASTLLGIAYGYEVQLKDDPFTRLSMEVISSVSEGLTPKFLVNIFPVRKYDGSPVANLNFLTISLSQCSIFRHGYQERVSRGLLLEQSLL